MNATAIQRAKEAIAAGKPLQCSPEADKTAAKDTTKKGATAQRKGAPAKGGKQATPAATPSKKEQEKAEKKAAAEKRAADQKAAKEAREAKEREEKAAKAKAYADRIAEQKAATIARHRNEKLFNSFKARVKYMLYMDAPALGGLDGKENLAWTLGYVNSKGAPYTVSRHGDKITVGPTTLKPMAADLLEDATLAEMVRLGWEA